MNEVKTEERRLWSLQTGDEEEARLSSFEEAKALAIARIEDGETMTLLEWRPPTAADVDVDCWTDRLWQWLGQQLEDDPGDGLETVDGYTPRLGDFTPPGVERHASAGPDTRVEAWDRLRGALWQVLRDHVDFCEAAWQPTGTTFVVTADQNPWRRLGDEAPSGAGLVEIRGIRFVWVLSDGAAVEPTCEAGCEPERVGLTDDAEWRYAEVVR